MINDKKTTSYPYIGIKINKMGKGKDAKKAVKKEATKSLKEKRAEKKAKKS
ncbi:MAG: hypothetical protein QMC21_06420 [Flavobacteriales bacterium]|jgi:hypothetical protein|tara:strand:+ start:9902 stop:10054 length:153 start_codon:yes stop_codon:yes gene_type:complete